MANMIEQSLLCKVLDAPDLEILHSNGVIEEMFLTCESRYSAEQSNFSKIPGSPVAYWLSSKAVTAFGKGNALGKLENVCGGLTTGDNNRFLRLWFEVNLPLISFDTSSMQETEEMKYTWYPMTKGGDYRKWYGNNEYVVNWKNNGEEIGSHIILKIQIPNIGQGDYLIQKVILKK